MHKMQYPLKLERIQVSSTQKDSQKKHSSYDTQKIILAGHETTENMTSGKLIAHLTWNKMNK